MKKSIATGAKRGSIGTLILEALSTSDKYGWEIIKEIENKSNGEYILKEPSLYSSLKRMETSGLITSYWQDSDIGGRRHYYNITQKGLDKLAKSNIEWSESKQFVNELFNDENKNASTVDSSIKALNKTVSEVQKTVSNLNKNDEEINEFLKQTDELEKNSQIPAPQIITEPKKTMSGLILPSINPLQQDLFSFTTSPSQNELEQKVEEKETQTIEQGKKVEQTQNEQAQSAVLLKEENLKPAQKPLKYTSTPNSYVQMPIFEAEQSVSLSCIVSQKEVELNTIEKETAEAEKPQAKPAIRHIKSLATEKDFLDHKYTFLNKKRSFINKVEDYTPSFNYKTDTELEKSDSLYGAFELKEEIEQEIKTPKSSFNNLGLEETLKAKQALLNEFKDEEKIVEETVEELQEIEKEDTSTINSIFDAKKAEALKYPTDDIDYKSILGDLLSETEQDDKLEKGSVLIKDLPRINVTDNINVSLKAKKKTQNEQEEQVYSTPTYTYDFTNTKPKKDVAPITEENYFEENYYKINKPVKELKNFNSNITNDDYSTALLQDAYLSDVKVRTHKPEPKVALMTTSYVSINKLNLGLTFALFILMLIQIGATYIGLTNAGYINSNNSNLFIIAFALSYLPVLFAFVIYLVNPNKKKEVNYNLLSKLGNNFIVLLIALVFIYATNLFLGMNNLNTMDFVVTWLLPAVLCANLLFSPIIKFVLLKRKKYYV
jgi:PadR family transcriptional regulator, regulatory protein PadR